MTNFKTERFRHHAEIQISTDHVFSSGTAPGPSCLRANHLKEAVLCPSPDRAVQTLRAISSVVKLLVAGLAPQEVVPHASLRGHFTAVPKEEWGPPPIAIGEVIRRLTSKCLSLLSRSEAVMSLTQLLNVGVVEFRIV